MNNLLTYIRTNVKIRGSYISFDSCKESIINDVSDFFNKNFSYLNYNVYDLGRRSGKTTLSFAILSSLAQLNKNFTGIYISPNENMKRYSYKHILLPMLHEFDQFNFKVLEYRNYKCIKLENGSEIIVLSASSLDRTLCGIKYNCLIADDVDALKSEIFRIKRHMRLKEAPHVFLYS